MTEIIGAGPVSWEPGSTMPIQQDQTENESAHSPSETAMLNDALSQIGATRITAIDDGTPNADYCKIFYPPILDAVLRVDHWNFAGWRAILNRELSTPVFGYTYKFALPPNWIKTRKFNDYTMVSEGCAYLGGQSVQLYITEGKFILTNANVAHLVYTRRVRDVGQWDALFYQIVCAWLASKLAMAIPKDQKKANDLLTTAMNLYLPLAAGTNGQENSNQAIESDSLTWGR